MTWVDDDSVAVFLKLESIPRITGNGNDIIKRTDIGGAGHTRGVQFVVLDTL